MSNKKKCEKCGVLYRSCSLHKHKPTGELRCRRCIAKYGENKYYIPLKERKNQNYIGKYSISNEESKRLFSALIRQGLSKKEASYRINSLKQTLRFNRKMKPRIKENQNKKLLQGLGQLAK